VAVCILTSSYPRFSGDYAGVFVAELARELVKIGTEVVILAPRAPGLDAFEILDGVRVYRFSYFWPRQCELLAYGQGIPSNLKRNPLLYLLLPFFLVGQLRALKRLVRQEKIRLINAHWMVTQGLVAAWLRKRENIRFVLTIHSAALQALVRFPFGSVVADWIVRHANYIFCVSSAHALLLQNFVGRKIPIDVLPMGVDLTRFDISRWPQIVARRCFGIGEGRVLMFLGRLEEIKGVHLLIEAVRSIPDFHNGKAFLYIAGDGQERSSLEGLVSQYQLEKGVRFLGTISREDVPVLLATADVVCVPSIVQRDGVVEGMPVVVLEALAMGKVLIASRVGGIPDLIQDGVNGFLVEPGNSRDLVSKIKMALGLRNEIAPVCEAARRTAEKFSLESVAQRYAEVFHSLQVTS